MQLSSAQQGGQPEGAKPQMTMVQGFVTPVLKCAFPGFEAVNEGLRTLILGLADPEPSNLRSNIGGWHSPNDFLKSDDPYVRQLLEWITTALTSMTQATGGGASATGGDFTVLGWANVLYPGGYNKAHTHNSYAWSGVYYVDIGDDASKDQLSGIIEFIDPRAGVGSPLVPGDPFDQPLYFRPQAGQMFMFPGWLRHYVHPYRGQRPRISVAFNVRWDQREAKAD